MSKHAWMSKQASVLACGLAVSWACAMVLGYDNRQHNIDMACRVVARKRRPACCVCLCCVSDAWCMLERGSEHVGTPMCMCSGFVAVCNNCGLYAHVTPGGKAERLLGSLSALHAYHMVPSSIGLG